MHNGETCELNFLDNDSILSFKWITAREEAEHFTEPRQKVFTLSFFFLQEFLHIVDKIIYCLIPLLISARMCAIFFLFFLFSVWVVNDIQEIFSVSLYLSLKPV